MAITESGPGGAHRGRLDNIVYYMLNGQQVARKIGRTTKPPSKSQLHQREKIKLINTFLSTMKDFLRVGFGAEAAGTTKSAFNVAVKENFDQLVTGSFPDLHIDYTRLIVSKGKLQPPKSPSVTLEGQGLQFNWETEPKMSFSEAACQAMLLIYFPSEGKSVGHPFGATRQSGRDELVLPEELRGAYMEIYMAFVSADRTQVSDSVYLGSLNKDTAQSD